MRNLLKVRDFSALDTFLSKASDMDRILSLRENGHDVAIDSMKSRVLGTLFLEPSTRTQMSFESAMARMDGKVVRIADNNSSLKGESLSDTIQTMSQYVDAMVVRTTSYIEKWGDPKKWDCPVINGGDGDAEHPTQALTDIYTIYKRLGEYSGLNIAIIGDLEKGRTVHSLVNILRYFDAQFFLYGNDLPDTYGRYANTVVLESEDDLFDVLPEIDVLYLTRTQFERGGSAPLFQLSEGHMEILPHDSLVMHPMPRTSELNPKFDDDPRCIYFEQSKNGVPVRMAILDWIFEDDKLYIIA